MSNDMKWCMDKIQEVALDLREPQAGSMLEHQAAKLDKVVERLKQPCVWQFVEDLPDGESSLYRGGCGEHKATILHGPPGYSFCPGCGGKVQIASDDPDIAPRVHGGGTGND